MISKNNSKSKYKSAAALFSSDCKLTKLRFLSMVSLSFVILSLIFMSGCTQEPPVVLPIVNNSTTTTPTIPPDIANDTPILPILNITTPENATAPSGNTSTGETLPVIPGEGQNGSNYNVFKSNDTLISTSNFSIPFEPYKPLKIYVINIGYGEAILLKKGEFEMLVDSGSAGGFPALDAFLKKLDIKKIEVVVATRSRADYIGAMPDLFANYNIEDFWHNNVASSSQEYTDMMAKAAENKYLVKLPNSGDVMTANGLKIQVLNPFTPRLGHTESDESDSIVLKVIDKDFCALLMSDAETGTEYRIMGAVSDLECPVIHIGRNGAGTATQASTLLIRVNPKVALISVGPNTDGNPKPTVLELLRSNKITTYRTDRDGTILITSDGTKTNYTVSTRQ